MYNISMVFLRSSTAGQCSSFQYECDNGQCIVDDYQCDGDEDCSDGSDEEGCGKRTVRYHDI